MYNLQNHIILFIDIMAEKNLHKNTGRLLVRVKPIFLKRIMENLSDAQRQWVVKTGFEKLLLFNIMKYPQPLSFSISKSYKLIDSTISIGENIINFSEDDVQNVLGLPNGELMFENSYNRECSDVGLKFRLNFLIALTNRTPYLNLKILSYS